MTDPIAERVRKVGGTTLRSVGDISRRQRILDNDAAYPSMVALPGGSVAFAWEQGGAVTISVAP